MSSTSETSIHSIQISAEEFAKFQSYQETSKPSSISITAIVKPSKSNTLLVSSSSKWVIHSGALDNMTNNSSVLSTF